MLVGHSGLLELGRTRQQMTWWRYEAKTRPYHLTTLATMSERKVLNKYYPPDFDPSVVKRRKTGGGRQKTVRLMAPFSMRCNTCGEYIYRGKKFNARKETVNDDDYYGITIYRFYIKCSQCSSEITFKTDPKNSDYAAEHGASRNFEPWRDKEEDKEPQPDSDDDSKSEEEVDPMKALEQRMAESQREMEVMDALQDIRTRNARFERMDTSTVLDTIAENKRKVASTPKEETQESKEDEELVRKFFPKKEVSAPEGNANDTEERPAQPAFGIEDKGAAPTDKAEPAANSSEIVPDTIQFLSERTREQLRALSAPKPAPKRKRGPNALGIVRKT